MIEMLNEKDRRQLCPLSWDEQAFLFTELPNYQQRMALYKVNSGSREQEVCKLRWDWEIPVPELKTSVFLIPSDFGGRTESSGIHNGEERLIVLSNIAKSVIDRQRCLDPEWIFPYGKPVDGEARPLHRVNDTAWRNARERSARKWAQKHQSSAIPDLLDSAPTT